MRRTILLLTLLSATACVGFHEVDGGLLRSPQLSEDLMVRRIQRHGVRTVVCLRGGAGAAATRRAALATGVRFHHVPMSARSLPPPEKLLALWEIAAHAQRPLLLHCLAGVDRTGLASAIIVLHDTGDLARARDQLDLIPYGHISIGPTSAMDEVLDLYEPHADTMAFPVWVREVYPGEREDAQR